MPRTALLATVVLLAACLLAWAPARAAAPVEIKVAPPAGPVKAGSGPHDLVIHLNIAKGLHINSPNSEAAGMIPTKVEAQAPQFVTFGPPRFPKPEPAKVQFSDSPIQVYGGKISIALPFKLAADAKPGPCPIKVMVSYQACDDKVCHFPQSVEAQITVTVK